MKISQTDLIYNILKDQKPHRTDEIVKLVYKQYGPSLARVGARIYDIKKKYTVQIEGWHDKKRPTLYWYMMIRNTFFYEKQSSTSTSKTKSQKKTKTKRVLSKHGKQKMGKNKKTTNK